MRGTGSAWATQAAERAAVAEAQSAQAADQAAVALEEQNRRAEEQAELAEGVPWAIAHRSGSIYDLWNNTDIPKFHVHISGEGVRSGNGVTRVDGRSSVDFKGLDAFGVGDRVLGAESSGRW